jgi:hypothetical protein
MTVGNTLSVPCAAGDAPPVAGAGAGVVEAGAVGAGEGVGAVDTGGGEAGTDVGTGEGVGVGVVGGAPPDDLPGRPPADPLPAPATVGRAITAIASRVPRPGAVTEPGTAAPCDPAGRPPRVGAPAVCMTLAVAAGAPDISTGRTPVAVRRVGPPHAAMTATATAAVVTAPTAVASTVPTAVRARERRVITR